MTGRPFFEQYFLEILFVSEKMRNFSKKLKKVIDIPKFGKYTNLVCVKIHHTTCLIALAFSFE